MIDIYEASAMWSQGHSATDIGARFGVTSQAIYNFAATNRSFFPVRQKKEKGGGKHYVSTVTKSDRYEEGERKPAPLSPDRVRRVTLAGAIVTLPRIPTIDGYAA